MATTDPSSKQTQGYLPGPDATGYETKGLVQGEIDYLCEVQSDPSAYSLSHLTNGTWARIEALSTATKGYVPRLTSAADLCREGIILTSNGPLTRGRGDAELAGPSDVTVRIEGVEHDVKAVDPVGGIIFLDGGIAPGNVVEIDYHYVSNPTLPFGGLNDASYLLNQWDNPYGHRFPFSTVLNGRRDAQPVQLGWRYRGFEREYSALLNDASTLALNEPVHNYARHLYKRRVDPVHAVFDGSSGPEGWTYVGSEILPFVEDSGDLLITDTSSSDSPATSRPSMYQRTADLREGDSLYWNGRVGLESHAGEGDFTGVGGGFVDRKHVYLCGYVEKDGELSVGLLGKGDEESFSSWRGWPAEIVDRGSGGITVKASDAWGLVEGDKVLHETGTYEITEVYTDRNDPASRYFEVDRPFPTVGSTEFFPAIEAEAKRTLRINRTAAGSVSLNVGSLAMPSVEVSKEDLPPADELAFSLDENTVFFGSVGRRSENEARWDLVRFDQYPESSFLVSRKISVRSEFNVLPAEDPNFPWTRLDDHGAEALVGGDHLLIDQGGSATLNRVKGSFGYGRPEPFLDDTSQFVLNTSFRIHEFARGMPASVEVWDGSKAMIVSVFDDTYISEGSRQSETLQTRGRGASSDGTSLTTSGHVADRVGADGDVNLWMSLSGAVDPATEGWAVSPDLEWEILHHRLRLRRNGSPGVLSKEGASGDSFQDWTLSSKLRLDPDGAAPSSVMASIGFDDGEGETYVGFVDDDGLKVTLVDSGGSALPSSSSFDFDWSDGPFQIRVQRSRTNLTVFVDGTFLGSFDLGSVSRPSSSGTPTARIAVFDSDGYVDVDYFDLHDVVADTEYVGIFTGGDPFDPDDYVKAPAEWFGVFLDLEVSRNPGDFVEVYANDQSSPVLTLPYDDLPPLPREGMNTSGGYVRFGALDSSASSQSLWKRVNYDIFRDVETEVVDKDAVLNRGGVMSSPESAFDEDPEKVTVPVDENYDVRLSREGMRADRVLSVRHVPSGNTLSFDFPKPHIVSVDPSDADPGDPVEVVFYHAEPFGFSYQMANEAYTKLNEGTPPFPKSQRGEIETKVVRDSVLNDPDDRTNTFEFVLNDGSTHFEVRDGNEGAYASLGFDWTRFGDDTVDLSPASDDVGWTELDVGRRDDKKEADETDHSDEFAAGGLKGQVSSSSEFDTGGVDVSHLESDSLVLVIDEVTSGSGGNLGHYEVDLQASASSSLDVNGSFQTPDSSEYRWKVLRDRGYDRTRHTPMRIRSPRTHIRHRQHVLPVTEQQARMGAYLETTLSEQETYAGAGDDVVENHPNSFMEDRYGSGLIRNPTATIRDTVSDPDGVKSSSVVLKTRTVTSSVTNLTF